MTCARWEGAGSGAPRRFAGVFPWQSFAPSWRFFSQPKLPPGKRSPLPGGLGSPSLAWDASLEEGGFAEHPTGTGFMARGQQQELGPHPGPAQATSPLTCCAIPGWPPPPTDAAAGACKSSPTAPVIPVLPTHAPLPGLLRPNLPWELLPQKEKKKKKRDASDNCKQKCTRGTWTVPRLFGIKALLLPEETGSAPSHGRWQPPASCLWPSKGHWGARGQPRSPAVGSPPLARHLGSRS